jgi:hypothetical protein
MSYSIVDFTKEHCDYLRSKTPEFTYPGSSEAYVKSITENLSPARTVIHSSNEILFSLGQYIKWPGVAESWTILPESTRLKYPKILHKATLELLDLGYKQYGFHRIETTVLAGFDAGHRWAKHLGFINEGPMYCYDSNKQTHYRYAKIYP